MNTEDIVHQAVDSFLCTLYGKQNYCRWKELKSRLCCTDERDFVEWMLDATECFYSNRITSTSCTASTNANPATASYSHSDNTNNIKLNNDNDGDDDDIKLEINEDEFYGEDENEDGLLEIADDEDEGSEFGLVIPSGDSLNTPPHTEDIDNADREVENLNSIEKNRGLYNGSSGNSDDPPGKPKHRREHSNEIDGVKTSRVTTGDGGGGANDIEFFDDTLSTDSEGLGGMRGGVGGVGQGEDESEPGSELKLRLQLQQMCDNESGEDHTSDVEAAAEVGGGGGICPYCCKEFHSKRYLRNHISVVHLHVKAHKCQLCNKDFSTKQNLKTHMRSVHLKLRPFFCDACHKTFSHRHHLKRHQFNCCTGSPGAAVM